MQVAPITASPASAPSGPMPASSIDLLGTIDDAVDVQQEALDSGKLSSGDAREIQQNLDLLDAFREKVQDVGEAIGDFGSPDPFATITPVPAPDAEAVARTYSAGQRAFG